MEQDQSRTGRVDYRYTLANERTFLAWMRTALALLAAAVAIVQFAPDLGSRTFRDVCAVVFAVLAAWAALGGLGRWLASDRAIREHRVLRRGSLPFALAVGLGTVGVAVVVVLIRDLG